jgi:uncharacterized membrane protein YgaE (UPF0421/DUF939 family)
MNDTTPRENPLGPRLLGAVVGALMTAGLALVIGASNPSHFWPAAAIAALCAFSPSIAVGMRLFADR